MSVLSDHIMTIKARGRGDHTPINSVIIMADTESSKSADYIPGEAAMDNHICLWTISLRAYHQNIVTLYGTKPSEMIECITELHKSMSGERTIIYFHNLSWDYVYLRKFMFASWGEPVKQLATKPHYPIWIKFENDINFSMGDKTSILTHNAATKFNTVPTSFPENLG